MKLSVIVTAGRLLNLEDCKRATASGRFLQNEVLKSDIHLESFGAAKAGESSISVACQREDPPGAGSHPDKDGEVCMDLWLWGILESRGRDIRGGPDWSGCPIPSISTHMEVLWRTKSVEIDDLCCNVRHPLVCRWRDMSPNCGISL
jgi:hypothetical protein